MLLSSRGLKNVNSDHPAFVFDANGKHFPFSRCRAQFISPAVSRSLMTDPTQTAFVIRTPDAEDCFHYLLSISEGDSIVVEQSQLWTFAAVCRKLENDELISILFNNESISTDNITKRLLIAATDSDVEFACIHFDSLNHSSLPINILVRLLDDHRLQIESEDWLFGIIEALIARDSSFFTLLDFVECQYLSYPSISRFISLLSIESLSWQLWSSICRRLSLSVVLTISNPRLTKAQRENLKLDRSRPFEGVFHDLWKECGQNPHIAGLIEISATDACYGNLKCYDLISHESKTGKYWGTSGNDTDQAVQIDFKDMRICPSAYSVKIHNTTWSSKLFLRSWQFDGSIDGKSWEVLDSHTNSSELSCNDKEMLFEFSSSTAFRFLRLVMIGNNSNGGRQFSLQCLEVFRQLSPKRQ
jgi:hypothetical protein